MKNNTTISVFSVILLILCLIFTVNAQNPSEESKITTHADGFQFTEGPAVDKEGNIYFTDIPNNQIHKWSVDSKLTVFLANTDGANGLFFDKKGNLVACVGGGGKIISIDKNKNITVLADTFKGKVFNSPNDLWVDSKGGVYFSDPRYGNTQNLPQDGEHVYYIRPDHTVIRIADDLVKPNGVLGTPDGKKLYIADAGAGKTYQYTINADGTLSNKILFADQGSDGMTIDRNGNIYLTDSGITVYAPTGTLISKISVPERPSNLCFGKDGHTLFITARSSFYSTQINDHFYSFTMDDIDGNPISLVDYKNKVIMVVNVASKCGYTKQYASLEKLYEKYKDRGFVILGFPANNFANQEPGTNSEIKQFCTLNYNATFPIFAKISVKGDEICPLYAYLTDPEQNGTFAREISWNFNKFLIDKNGKTIAFYPSQTDPMNPEVLEEIEKALNN